MPITHSTVSALLGEAESFLEEYPPNIEQARNTLEQAVNADPENPQVLDACGAFFIEYDDERIGVLILKKSIQIAPNSNPVKYFYLGQVSQGKEAVAYYTAGIELCRRLGTRDGLISALCSIGELWMTEELCDEPEARGCSEGAFRAALREDGSNIEAISGLATFCKVVGEHAEATELCNRAVALLSSDTDEASEIPFPIRLALTRTLIDLEMGEQALSVLHYLLDEDEEDVEVWFLVACAHLMSDDFEAATEAVSNGIAICKKDEGQKQMWWESLKNLVNVTREKKDQFQQK